MAGIKFDGLDDFIDNLEQLAQNAQELDGEHEVPLSELFTQAFMEENTHYSSFGDLLEAGGFHADSAEAFDSIPESELDAHIARTTKFDSWESMLEEATGQYVTRKLGF